MNNVPKLKIMNRVLTILMLIMSTFLFPDIAISQAAKKISIQGILKDGDGVAVTNGNYSLTFTLYDAISGGTQVWTETQPNVAVRGGVYSALLGSVNDFNTSPHTANFAVPYFLGVSVNGGVELTPRTELSYAPYALAVDNAATVSGLAVHSGRNNESNKVVRTDGNGYLNVGYINSSNGNEGNNHNPPRVWGTNGSDNFMRSYLTSALHVGNAAYATNAGRSATLQDHSSNNLSMKFHWAGQGGQPTWLWGSTDGTNHHVYNPSNFSVNYANTAGSATTATTANALNTANNYTVNAIRATGSHADQTGQGGASWRYLYGFNGNHGNLGSGLGVIATSMGATNFFAFSDERIKKDIRPTNPMTDAQLLKQFEVVDYRYQDSVDRGNETVKGFIAQQVQSVLPEAVTSMTDVVPDIYTLSTSVIHSKNESLISINNDHLLNAGDRVKVLWDKGEKIVDVIKCPTSKQFVVKGLSSEVNSVFVFGKEVNDFLTVNYDRIYTIGISVTQQLMKKVSTLENENRHLKTNLSDIKDELRSMASRLSKLENSDHSEAQYKDHSTSRK